MSSVEDQPKAKRNRHFTRPSISVSGKTYDRLRTAYPLGRMAPRVDDMIATALDDPEIAAGIIARIQQADAFS